jgi:hypothetical protein
MFVHWSQLRKPYGINTCLGFARDAITSQGLGLIDEAGDGDYVVMGKNDAVIVHVVVVPEGEGSWVGVSAYSTEDNVALDARAKVRDYIENVMLID